MSKPCPECSTQVDVPEDLLEGELLICDHCGVELEVLSVDPLQLAIFEEEEK
ncbi:MAG: lysine biosynthesis protein LysW [Myxococcota bacterium]|nr:lysine biosynthesis protein LysW [Myxococcota bacterium]